MTMEHIESQVARAILEENDRIVIDDRTYEVSQPTLGTLIMASELASKTTPFTTAKMNEILPKAHKCANVAKIAAVMILGAKRIKEHRNVTVIRRIPTSKWSWLRFKKAVKYISYREGVDELEYLTEYIQENLTISELSRIVAKLLSRMQVVDFFGLTTSLCAVNLLKSTKEVETASGD